MTQAVPDSSETATSRRTPARLSYAFVGTIALGTLLQALNSSMIAVAIVPIREDFHAGAAVSWLLSGLYLATMVGAPTMGRIADMVGPRRIFLTGLGIVALASTAAPFAQDIGWLIACRVLLGIGTSAQYPAGVALIRAAADKRGASAGSALGLLALCAQVAVALGPAIGGGLVALAGWQSIFLVNLPLVLFAAVLMLLRVPRDGVIRAAGLLRRLDPLGIALFAAAMSALVLFLLSVGARPNYALLVGFLALLGAFVWWEHRAADPFIDPRLLADNRALTATYLRTATTYVAFYLIFFGLPQWLEQGRGLDSAGAGLVVLPIAALGAVTVLLATRLERRAGARPTLIIGSVALALGGLAMALLLHSTTPIAVLVAVSALLGLPNGFNSLGNQTAMVRAAPAGRTGAASGLYRTSQYVGANLAAALIEVVGGAQAGDVGLHRMGVVVAAIGVVLAVAAVFSRQLRRPTGM